MNRWRQHFRAEARATEPDASAVDRLRHRSLWPRRVLQTAHPEPGPGAVVRLRARHATSQRRAVRLVWALPLIACAAIGALVWVNRPPKVLSEQLEAQALESRTLTEDVHLEFSGTGTVDGTERAPHIRWEAGVLDLDVTPDRGINLVVDTDEGEVAVVGTAFSVTRDALGTLVSVTRGHVRVACHNQAPTVLGAGETATCLPVRAAAWIGRARALLAAGRPADEVLAAVRRGLSLASEGDPATGELVALRIRVLVDAGRYTEALAAANDYLASGASPRRAEVEALAVDLRKRP